MKQDIILVPDSILSVKDGQKIFMLVMLLQDLPKETTKTKDITGGLPRVAELFEAEKQKIVQSLQKMMVK